MASKFGVLYTCQNAHSIVGAVQRDDPETLEGLLEESSTFGCDDLAKALHVAADRGLEECTCVLLKAKAMPDIHDLSGCTPLIIAAKRGHYQVIRHLIKAGCNINKASFRVRATALHWAATNGHLTCVRLLLREGCSIQARTMHGRTPLILAARADMEDIVEELIDYGADVNMADNHGASALHLASEEGSTDCVRLLLKAKANVNAKKRNGDTPIMLAAQRGQSEVMRQLIRQPLIDVTGRSREMSPLHWAAKGGSKVCVDLLLKYGSNPNIYTLDSYYGADFVVGDGVTPLMLACHHGHSDVVEILIAEGCDINMADCDGYTALLYAVKSHSAACVDILIAAGADSNGLHLNQSAGSISESQRALSPLFLAIKENSSEVIKALLRANCKVNMIGVGQKGEFITPFELALTDGKIDICRMLLIGGGEFTVCNSETVAEGLASLFEKDEDMFNTLVRELYTPRTLFHLGRKCIRDNVNVNMRKGVQSLAIPEPIRKFLLLQELDDF